jgi:hypothetical protein
VIQQLSKFNQHDESKMPVVCQGVQSSESGGRPYGLGQHGGGGGGDQGFKKKKV